ncbi:N-acetyltransferase esco2 [Mortierella sp. NVP85]|nr:N-acetyltransferase esco2 [Mortierella sp. NVP85]
MTNTPASSSIPNGSDHSPGLDSGSGPSPPVTPKRDYAFHKVVRNTYGRAKSVVPSDSPSSSDLWASYSKSADSNSRSSSPLNQHPQPLQRSRLSGLFSELKTTDSLRTTSRGARTSTERLEHAEQGLDSDDDDDADDSSDGKLTDDKRNTTRTSTTAQDDGQIERDADCEACTPPKRKRHILEAVVIPVKQSPRSTLKTQPSSSPPPSRSPSPPASPSLRASKRSRVEVVSAVIIPSISSVKSKAGNGVSALPEKRATQQATLSSFFAPKAGQGTGILKSRTIGANGKINSDDGDGDGDGNGNAAEKGSLNASSSKITGSTTKKLSSVQAPPKLEQLFLAFSKDRTKSTGAMLSSGTASGSKTLSTAKPTATRLSREDERSRRYHCPQCGMPYVRGQPEDEQIHEKYHRAILGGLDYPGYKNEVVVATFTDLEMAGPPHIGSSGNTGSAGGGGVTSGGNSRIVMVSMSDTGKPTTASSVSSASSFEKRKVKEVLQHVNEELGSVDFDPEKLDSCKVFLYISGRKKVIGCAIVERIKQGFCIVPPSEVSNDTADSTVVRASTTTTTAALTPAPTPATSANGGTDSSTATKTAMPLSTTIRDHEGSAIFCSTEPQPAICGINRIWVSTHHRRHKVASRLLDAVRDRFVYACKLEKTDLAFSQPTGDGKALARQYLGTDKFLVYVE